MNLKPARPLAAGYYRVPVVVLVLCCAILSIPLRGADETATPSPEFDEQTLNGKWQRPDGGYVIEITVVHPDGRLDAAYYNPRPINIARAAWRIGGGRLQVLVILNDEGYPNATYVLHYDPEKDQLFGDYTQPAAEQTFEVNFVRMIREQD